MRGLAVQHTREQANGQVAVLEPHVPLQGCLPLALDAWLGVPAVREKKGDASSAELDRRLVVLELKLADQVDAQVVQLCTSLEVLSSGARAWGWIGPTGAGSLGLEGEGGVISHVVAREVAGRLEVLGIARTPRIAALSLVGDQEECFTDGNEAALLALEVALEGSEQVRTLLTLRRHATGCGRVARFRRCMREVCARVC